MQQEIKFRGWNGERMLLYENWFTLHQQNVLCFGKGKPSYVDESDIDYPSRIILMQYTGLLDKYKKEIYTADIIRLVKPYADRHGYHTGVVEKICGGYIYRDFNGEVMSLEQYSPETDYEVIGDIYRNKELLP
jgi:uncharacterized phage protein (TIGR01671 family)